MPLYRAVVEVEICFWAENKDSKDAHRLAYEYLGQEIEQHGFVNSPVSAYLIKDKKDIPFDFREELPWGREDELSCSEVFDLESINLEDLDEEEDNETFS